MANSDNPRTGAEFEKRVKGLLAKRRIPLERDFSVPVGAGRLKRIHKFDLGSAEPPVLVECKAHTWTEGGNAPSAKLTVWNEAMFYFQCAPRRFRKILFVLRHERRGETIAQHYIKRYSHLIPTAVEIWELNPLTGRARVVYPPANGASLRKRAE